LIRVGVHESAMSLGNAIPDRLSNRYQVLNLLSDGGFGKTYLVQDIQMPSARKCVLKQLKPVLDKPQIYQMVQERFQREAAILELLGERHDQIPQLYAYFSEGEQFYLVEEWIQGATLTQIVQQQGVLDEAQVRSMLVSLLNPIAFVHQHQIVHRDIKPDNIVLRQSDGKPVLIDFGAVKETMSTVVNSQGNSTHSIVVGTPGYMPSEQLAGRPVFASDLYSLGLTAVYLLTGRIPQQLDNDPLTGNLLWQTHAPTVSPELAAVLNRVLHLHPSQRFATAAEMLAALSAPATLPPTPPPIVTTPPAINTIASAPQTVSAPNTEIEIATAAQPVSIAVSPREGQWKVAVLTGGIIGTSILIGALLLKGQLPGFSNAVTPAPSPSASSAPASPSPVASSAPPSSAPASSADSSEAVAPAPSATKIPKLTAVEETNATIVGEPGSKNIRSGPDTDQQVLYEGNPGDRIRIVGVTRNADGFPWFQIQLPNGSQGWLASQLVKPDTSTGTDAFGTDAVPSRTDNANATVTGRSGTKNIRSGPGINYSVQGNVTTGDRVRIIGSSKDSGGYVWYRVVTAAGARGWIAAQLVDRD
jgi:serine/threonine-protein kinase